MPYKAEVDFNTEQDAKESPLIPEGTYHGSVTNVKFDPEKQAIVWSVTLADNGGNCTDDETLIDGATLTYNNWLPRKDDKDTPTKSGRSSKFQAKMNMLKEFATKMNVDMGTPEEIFENIENAEWVGLACDVRVSIREWEGSIFNDIQKMYAA